MERMATPFEADISSHILASPAASDRSEDTHAVPSPATSAGPVGNGSLKQIACSREETIESLSAKVAKLEEQLSRLMQSMPSDVSVTSKSTTPLSPPLQSSPSLAKSGRRRSAFELGSVVDPANWPLHDDGKEEIVSMAATRVVMHQIVLPAEVDSLGICFGGQVLSWIDICAGLAAKTVARGPVVTASVDTVHFLRPCHQGSVAIIAAMVNRVFQSSMEVGVRVEEEDVKTGARHHCCSAYLTFVSVLARPGADGRPARRMKRVAPTLPTHTEIFEAAERRRRERLHRRAMLQNQPETAVPRLQPITHREGSATLAPALQAAEAGARMKRAVTPAATLAHMTQLIMPQHANSLGITFGGQVMRWMEQCAYIAASRIGRSGHLLTGSLDSLAFAQPTRVGDIMYVTAQVTGAFGSSMEVMISVCGETPTIGEVFHCGDAYATVVSVDTSGNPVELPFELAPDSPADKLRCAGAADRRDERLGMRHALLMNEARRPSLDGSLASARHHHRQQVIF
ncbi:g6477 [Coccomyxa viridis]|uniref:G6477 protein n=1 Tax=Coccomyxa viridis TaxID=1274662 RepID=A0ABP1FVG2_9CHLO